MMSPAWSWKRCSPATATKWWRSRTARKPGKSCKATDPPRLAVLDWLMDEMDGVEVCRRVRERPELRSVYLILLTSRGDKAHLLEGLQAGANDYVTKPFDRDELLARVRVGAQMLGLQAELAARVHELEDALTRLKQLQGLLPICSYCKSIRDDHNYWHKLETYVKSHSEAEFSHGICPSCWEKVVKPQFLEMGITAPDQCPQELPQDRDSR